MQAYELLEMRKHHCMGFVPTSLLKLDKALQGGLHCGTVTEVTLSGVGVAGMSRGSTSAHAHTHTHTHTHTMSLDCRTAGLWKDPVLYDSLHLCHRAGAVCCVH